MTGNSDFALLLFSVDPDVIGAAVSGGVRGIVVDWEHRGKSRRQSGFDTEVNHLTLRDLKRVRECTAAPVICRINAVSDGTALEVEAALDAGTDEILLPMVRTVQEVEDVLELIRGRCGVGVLVETEAGVAISSRLAPLPLSRVYVGLNDLAIDRGLPNIFASVADGTVERVRALFSPPFGFGGLTLPDRGHPIPCRLLMAEMARLGCQFSFLRRSFHRDVSGLDVAAEVRRICAAIKDMRDRTPAQLARDQAQLHTAIQAIAQEAFTPA
jgi:hypothetical protein